MDADQLEICENFDLFREYGSSSKIRGTKRVLQSTFPSSVTSINFYKAADLNGIVLRHPIIQAGNALRRIEPDGTLTNLYTTQTNRYWVDTTFDYFMLLANQNPYQRGDGDTPVKYDGQSVTRLGVTPPGSNETTIDHFSNATIYSNLTNVTLFDERTITWSGDSVKVLVDGAGVSGSFSATYTPFSVSTQSQNRAKIRIYLPRGEYIKLATSGTVFTIRFQSSPGNYYDFYHSIGDLGEGWNDLNFDFSVAPTGDAGISVGSLDTNNINFVIYTVNKASLVTTLTCYIDALVVLDQGTPTVAFSATTNIDLNYDNVAIVTATGGVASQDVADKTEGTGSVKMTKTTTTSVNLDLVNNNPLAIDLSTAVQSQARIDVYIGDTAKLAAKAVFITLSTDAAFATSSVFQFNLADLTTGWNTVVLNLAAPDTGTGGGAILSNINYIRVRFVFASQTYVTVANEFYKVDNFRHTTSSGGALNGDYQYRITYVSKYGQESNSGPNSKIVTPPLPGASINLTNIPVSLDPQVVQRNIYRTASGGVEFGFLASIFDNTTTTYLDILSDGALIALIPPSAGDGINDFSPPPQFGFMRKWKRTVFGAGDPLNPNILYYSNDDSPEEWPVSNAVTLDARITGFTETNLGFIVTTDTGYWRILGDNPNFILAKIADGFGCVGPRALGVARRMAYIMDKDGIRLYDLQDLLKLTEPIRDKFEIFEKLNLHDAFVINSRRFNILLAFIPDNSGAASNILAYHYIRDELNNGQWSTINIPAEVGFFPTDVAEIEDENGEWHIYVSSTDGQVYELFAIDSFQWTRADGTGVAITSRYQTPYIRPGGVPENPYLRNINANGQGRMRVMFAELRIDGDLSGCTWTAQFEGQEGSAVNSTPIVSRILTFNFAPGQSLKRIRPQDMAPWEFVRVTVKNEDLGKDLILRGLRVYYTITEGPFIW